jgi:hypothetical protein
MLTHSLNLEPEAHDQDVLCVHTALPSYLFAFKLNRLLRLSLRRSPEDIGVQSSKQGFAVYEYDCAVMQQSWRIVENHVTTTSSAMANSLFSQTEQRVYLFSELDYTDLLVCVNGLTNAAIKKISAIERVISCYRLPKKRKNIKEQLTF